MLVGDKPLTFELVPDWEQLPSGWGHGDVAGVSLGKTIDLNHIVKQKRLDSPGSGAPPSNAVFENQPDNYDSGTEGNSRSISASKSSESVSFSTGWKRPLFQAECLLRRVCHSRLGKRSFICLRLRISV